MTFFDISLALFLVINPFGNLPAFLPLLKDFDRAHQQRILLRECFFSFLVGLFFACIGESFLSILAIEEHSVRISGSVLLFIVGITMIYPELSLSPSSKTKPEEPFFVPIATPIVSGPGVIATIMILASRPDVTNSMLFASMIVTWSLVGITMVGGPLLMLVINDRGLQAMERLMGMIILLLAIEMFRSGLYKFILSF